MEVETRDETSPEARVLMLTNLHFFATEIDVRRFFRGFRVMDYKRGVNPRNGNPSATGYVLMASLEDAKGAMQACNGWKILTRVVDVSFAKRVPKVNETGFCEKSDMPPSIAADDQQTRKFPVGAQQEGNKGPSPIPTPRLYNSGPRGVAIGLRHRELQQQKKSRYQPGVVLQKIPEPKSSHQKTHNGTPRIAKSPPRGPKLMRAIPQGHQIRQAELFGKTYASKARFPTNVKPIVPAGSSGLRQQEQPNTLLQKKQSPSAQALASLISKYAEHNIDTSVWDSDMADDEGSVSQGSVSEDGGLESQAGRSHGASRCNSDQTLVTPQRQDGPQITPAVPRERIQIIDTGSILDWSLSMPQSGEEPYRDIISDEAWYTFLDKVMRGQLSWLA